MLYTSPWAGVQPTTSVVIGTDCIGSYKSNYHTITATTATLQEGIWMWIDNHRRKKIFQNKGNSKKHCFDCFDHHLPTANLCYLSMLCLWLPTNLDTPITCIWLLTFKVWHRHFNKKKWRSEASFIGPNLPSYWNDAVM